MTAFQRLGPLPQCVIDQINARFAVVLKHGYIAHISESGEQRRCRPSLELRYRNRGQRCVIARWLADPRRREIHA
jgi:hypothetical protein